jgi:hypothetical protein
LYLKRNGTLTENMEAHNISGSNNSKEKIYWQLGRGS